MTTNKGALALLAGYGSDSSDDEVPGCRVSTKRPLRDDDSLPKPKRLPAPNFAWESLNEHSDDSELHEGRIRSFPHERGNWATFVYIPFENTEGIDRLICKLSTISICDVQLKPVNDLHLSLTKTVVLKHHWIELFVDSVRSKALSIHRFIVMFSGINVYCNEEKTRTFIGLDIKSGYDSLMKLISSLDRSLQEFNLPTFYEDPSFHVSLMWCLGDQLEILQRLLPTLNTVLNDTMSETSQECWYKYVQQIVCKTGNKTFHFDLL